MKNLLLVAVFIAVAFPATADEFGSRFGRTAPYALGNDVSKAIADTQGMDLDDLNDIAPAAGAAAPADAVEAEVEAAAEACPENSEPSAPGAEPCDADKKTQPDQSSGTPTN